MAHFGRKTVLLLVFLTVLTSIVLRYPLVEHERHNDTFFNRLLADSILENEYAVWTFHPLSYIGYYPASYPSGTPFLLAEISELTGMGMSLSIMVFSMFCGVLFVLSTFCLLRVLLRRVDLLLLATILAALAPRFIDTSYWSGSARAPFIALAVMASYIAARIVIDGKSSLAVPLGIAILGCFALHHMAIVFILFAIAYALNALLLRGVASFSHRIHVSKRRGWLAGSIVMLLGIGAFLGAGLYLSYYGTALTRMYASTSLFSFEPIYASTLLNMAASYTNQMGLILPIAVLSLPIYFSRVKLTTASLFPVVLVMCFVPLLPSAEYITMILTPFVAAVGVRWFGIALSNRGWRRVVMSGLILLICASLLLPVWSSQRWNGAQETSGDTTVSDSQLFTDAAYLQYFEEDHIFAISNDNVLSTRLAGASGVVFLRSGVLSALSGDATAESIKGNLSWTTLNFPLSLYQWFEYEDESAVSTYMILFMLQGHRFPASWHDEWLYNQDYYEVHSKLLVVVDNRWPTDYVWATEVLPANLPSELEAAQWWDGVETYPLQSYSIYISERVTLYATEIPKGLE